ncbi:sperm-associated antigen 7 homolog [Pollicipes pollicipes]|uniref:sperm-associated antigen 7 homolog n=1 Tax=Pollicipes pollicipes TaxID=41117 RepID=UPI0018852C4A|nr:sperm-associated antigen 7 homolog [Pollicipes pollicipes]XP_037085840.1 sperm-associated antigen 7 homolog [Pollicipes pollicipes]XP_037085841.1 sperm-associated antigen 7 homolog [Pollicipes pollicipes]XP_037085842.1 sperm-associated antigen 7 homolog [Pollicipes pollicipes]XP_037085843.1 sperm-associated antigen 7 homolog [Pollicipes pollicipes]XP_037085844.1 sperm-associated antigen 7 homolog [Pollicipes pollicipes]
MDLLGSIMSKMEKPPVTTTQAQREAKKKQIEEAKKLKEKEKEMLLKFRKEAETEVQKFMKDDVLLKKQFPPMNEVQRSILHDVAEVAGLVCHAFGEEGVDRHIMLFKKEYELAAEEVAALRRGEEYDPARAKEEAFQRDLAEQLAEQEQRQRRGKKAPPPPPAAFLQKRQHLFADDSAQRAAVNSSFGVVSSSLKTDKRSIEETLADIRAKKRRQRDESEQEAADGEPEPDTGGAR